MEVIRRHIDFLFEDLPKTAELTQKKNDLYMNAIVRFEELRAEGKSESEALGLLIIEIGDRETFISDLKMPPTRPLMGNGTNTLDEVKDFLSTYREEARKIGLGIGLIMIGTGLIPSLSTFDLEMLGVILLLVWIASAVGLFITSGLKIEAIEKPKPSRQATQTMFTLSDEDYDMVETQYILFKNKNRFRIPLGVMLCILSAVPIVFFSFLENDALILRYGVLLLTLAITVGVYQFVQYGMGVTAYEKVLGIGEYSPEERAFQQKMEPIGGIYWMVVTIVYLIWSFLSMDWHFTWIIWPIAGAVWGLVVLILKGTRSSIHSY